MSARLLLIAGVAALAIAWLGPLPRLVPASFAAHMTLHMLVVGIAAPLLAAGLARRVAFGSQLVLPVAVSLLDFVVIWAWHAPALHHASRTEPLVLALEQACFFGVALLVWLVALGSRSSRNAGLAGALTLFFTSMHMTLLGALLGLAPRPIYGHAHQSLSGLSALEDQQLGGVVMLAVGGVIYLAGALMLMRRVLAAPRAAS